MRPPKPDANGLDQNNPFYGMMLREQQERTEQDKLAASLRNEAARIIAAVLPPSRTVSDGEGLVFD